ncbi:MAG: hypothetical protein ABIR19_07225 [Ginsengibacter sp.]
METNKYIGLIECGSNAKITSAQWAKNINGYKVKKVMSLPGLGEEERFANFPEAKMVDNIGEFIHDSDIELILVSKPKNSDITMIGEAIQAGKSVRII